MCPENFSCVPNATGALGQGTCRRTATVTLGLCNTGPATGLGGDTCPTGTYCRAFNASAGFPRPSGTRYSGPQNGMCVPPVREGGVCDSDFGNVGSGVGRQCEAGTVCDALLGAAGARRCQRPCRNGITDCPCDTPGNTITCMGGGSQPYCSFCFANQTECTTQLGAMAQCCDPSATCQTVSIAGASQQQCCVSNGTSCSTNSQCCANSICRPDGKCGACVPAGSSGTTAQCCAGLTAVGGICSVACPNPNPPFGDARPRVGLPCPVGLACTGTIECSPTGAFRCAPPPGTPAAEIYCDMMDEDCSGEADEDLLVSCTFFPPGCPTQITASWSGIPGRRPCNMPTAPCRPIRTPRFCSQLNSLVNGPGSCSTGPLGVACTPATCNSREICGRLDGFVCTAGDPSIHCNIRDDRGGCTEAPFGMTPNCIPACRPNPTADGLCWNVPL